MPNFIKGNGITTELISEIRTYRKNSISMIICIKRRRRKFGFYQSGIAEKSLLIDLSGTYDIIEKVKRALDFLGQPKIWDLWESVCAQIEIST